MCANRSVTPDLADCPIVGATSENLNVHYYGPTEGPRVLALHGITGHGGRWRNLAANYLPEARVIAPDLRGHGRSPALPPWGLDAHVADVVSVLDGTPAVVVGHSFGGAVAVRLATRYPELVRSLVLLDPAVGLPPELLLDITLGMLGSPDYTDVAEARSDKLNHAWGDVPPELLEAELAEHLIPSDNGRVGWRISLPAITAGWGELAQPYVLPPAEKRTVLVQAMKVQPPIVMPNFRAALVDHLGSNLTVHDFDCDHMVAQARPAEVADLVRPLL